MTGPVLSGGHYRLGERLDPAPAGSRGDDVIAVHHAHDTWEDRAVLAVSMPPAGGSSRPTTADLTRVARDVRRAEGADHPGLVGALDVAVDTERGLWLVHAVPQGARTLVAARDDPPPAETVLRWALDLAGALVAAHSARLVHGRLAPEAVVVDAREAAHLLAAPSGLRPDDRPGAEDADARALATVLRGVLADPDPAGEPLAALLDAVAAGRAPAVDDGDESDDRTRDVPPGGLTPALDEALRRLGGPAPVVPPVGDTATEDDTTQPAALAEEAPTGATAVVPVVGGGDRAADGADRTTTVVRLPDATAGPAGPTTRVVLPAAADRTAALPTGSVRPATPPATTPWAPPGPPRAGPSWSGPPAGYAPATGGSTPTGGGAPPAGPAPQTHRTVLVVLGIVLALALAVGVVLVVLLGTSGRSVPNPAPGPSVTAPNGRVVPAVAVPPRGDRSDTLGRFRRGGLEMAHTHATIRVDRTTE